MELIYVDGLVLRRSPNENTITSGFLSCAGVLGMKNISVRSVFKTHIQCAIYSSSMRHNSMAEKNDSYKNSG